MAVSFTNNNKPMITTKIARKSLPLRAHNHAYLAEHNCKQFNFIFITTWEFGFD